MIEIWTDSGKPVSWASWGEGPITVARPPEVRRLGGGHGPAEDRWGIFHRRTGRELATGLLSSSRKDWLALHQAILSVTPANFWSGFVSARLGDPFEFPAELLGRAMARVNVAHREDALEEARALRDEAARLVAGLYRRKGRPLARKHAADIRRLKEAVEKIHAAF